MALTLNTNVIVFLFMILGTWASLAMSRTLHEAAMVEKHEQWMVQHGRTYEDQAEKEMRFEIFKQNLEFIENFNKAGNRSYSLSINQFSDLTDEEFLASHTGYKLIHAQSRISTTSFSYENQTEVPSSLNWREQGAVTDVKDQGSCGCCWAFSAVAAMEGITKIKKGTLISLSEQQLLDCSTNGNYGCNGGLMNNAFEYIIDNQGLTSESNYEYQEMQGNCQTQMELVAQIQSYQKVPRNNEEALLQAVAKQPVSIAIDASGIKSYSGGIFDGDCGTNLNHAVTIIGYGSETDGTEFWLIKNSWGETWGEDGYIKMKRNADAAEGLCGLAMDASYPIA
ncbi:ervatamin-B-like [Mangifera indica]|uniref:ervatamin-B-like n=1 Tax=Mangifera indica TaxID=29780 RepID=UPI001CFB57D2|nr:ervatamin-B-like [Mangifera indica]